MTTELTQTVSITEIRDLAVEFLEDFPEEPEKTMYGTPIYYIHARIGGDTRRLELYHRQVVTQLKAAGNLCGRKAMIQLPEQEGAVWCAQVFG